ncbi:hypothetical protein Nepgr_008698 [Nepenthes gracilis]|uniref:Uncharacterized protein n=1 Tax=Nepenthes gracilis TaxID=150966 RepID=A0AAD3S952_NEPGR|nr:hypothetical protein Nepgr_008698 [Nepenthes gracilis]
MDSNVKRRGLIKVKLMPLSLYKAVKTPPAAHSMSKIKPKQSSPAAASVGYLVNQDMKPQTLQQVSFIVSPDDGEDSIGHVDNYFGAIADERVNMKAAHYISCVRERFRLERINSD